MNVVLGIFWALTMLGAVIRAASYAATALAFAILPYCCFTRALSEIGK